MLTVEIFFRSLGALIVLLFSFINLGDLFFRLFRKFDFANAFERLYWSGLGGLLLTVSVYAIFVTGFQTILIICPILLVLFAYVRSISRSTVSTKIKTAQFLYIALAIILYFSFFLSAFLSVSNPGMIKFAALDNLYYARLAAFLNFAGREISTPEYLFPDSYSTMPYHYGDIWLCAFISKFADLKSPFALLLVAYPLLSILAVLGIAGFLVQRFVYHRYWIFITIPALFFSGITFLYPVWLGDGFGPRPVANYPKVLWITAFLTGTLILVAQKNFNALYLIAVICGITFINTLPALIIAMTLFSILQVFIFRKHVRTIIPRLLMAILTPVYIFCFYQLTSVSESIQLSHTSGMSTIFTSLKHPLETLKTLLLPLRQVMWFLPFMLFSAWICYQRRIPKKEIRSTLVTPECIWFLLLLLSGLATWVVTRFFTMEAAQFYYNLFLPLSSIGIAVWVYWILRQKHNVLLKCGVIVFMLYFLFRNYEYTYDVAYRQSGEWSALVEFLGRDKAPVFVNLKSDAEISGIYQKNTRLFQPLPEINYLLDNYINESLNIPSLLQDSTAISSPTALSLLRHTSFYQYLQSQPLASGRSQNELMWDFSKAINARYLLISKQTQFPEVFRSAILDSIQLSDQTLYKLQLN